MKRDLYQVLEVNPRASETVIEAAYRALMKEVHPDVGASVNGTRAIDLNEAHDILTDSLKRKDYDRSRQDLGKTVGSYKLLGQIAEGGFETERTRWVSKGAWKFTENKEKLLDMIPKYE
jgi:DnaJ-class molecular chaperone